MEGYALRDVVQALHKDIDSVTLAVKLGEPALHQIWRATEKLRVADIKASQERGDWTWGDFRF